ncbi:hypothetical protein GCM10010985_21960 [Caballeronia grimmiae]|uniref:Uncharacterized protein n=1 Tax=Caballeronia grimmiae TaxID=1071679 RepID=A0ABQ1RDW9_9BURK|nr:hypothetical protein GCM10010985_21960 [Caballeronia grimmiae]
MVFHHESESGAWLMSTNLASGAACAGDVVNNAALHNAAAAASARSAARPLQRVIVSTYLGCCSV